ncbi:MAG: alkaline phosphatase [Bryobacteraceae bacterium]|nr:MAG: alkaline phosphatase [Bryobacteraceae bacterium]
MRRFILSAITSLLLLSPAMAQKRAKNVILFLADAAGVPTVSAASLHGYGEPLKLYVQSWPHMGLMDTTTASAYVTDSAAGMTAIVTGVKTQNGVISMGPDTERGKKDGRILKTLLEYAEEKGLATGVLTNVSIADATPAACYGHANDRRKQGELFLQIFRPRFGDGPDVVIGAGRKTIWSQAGSEIETAAQKAGRRIYASLADVPESERRPIVVSEGEMDVAAAARRALKLLSANRRGYFLMIEWDAHTDNPRQGLDNLVRFDRLIREIASQVNLNDTLLVFTADHSFELRITGGRRGVPLLEGLDEWMSGHSQKDEIRIPALRVGHSHTGEEVLIAAMGAGAERVRGYMPNTRVFEIIMQAWGWRPEPR